MYTGILVFFSGLCSVMGHPVFSDYRCDVSDLVEPTVLYLEAIHYWRQVMRKLNTLQPECGCNYVIREQVSTLLESLMDGLTVVWTKEIIHSPMEHSYLDIVYYPEKYLTETRPNKVIKWCR